MSQDTLIEKIKNDAAQTVEEIKAQGTAAVESIQREIEAEIAKLQANHEAELEKKKSHQELVTISKAKQAGNIAVQTVKREQIDNILTTVRDELANQSAADYVKFFAKFVAAIVPKDAEIAEVHAPTSRTEETAEILAKTGLRGEVKTDGAIQAGLVVKTKDGVYDITLGRLMNDKRATLEMVIVNKVGV